MNGNLNAPNAPLMYNHTLQLNPNVIKFNLL